MKFRQAWGITYCTKNLYTKSLRIQFAFRRIYCYFIL